MRLISSLCTSLHLFQLYDGPWRRASAQTPAQSESCLPDWLRIWLDAQHLVRALPHAPGQSKVVEADDTIPGVFALGLLHSHLRARRDTIHCDGQIEP